MIAPALIAGIAALAAGGLKYGGWDAARKEGRQTYADTINKMNEAKDILAQTDPEILKQLDPDQLNQLVNEYAGVTYTPEFQQYIAQASPFEYNQWQDVEAKQVDDSPQARAIQMQALTDLQKRAEEGLDAQSQQDYMKGQMQAGEFAKGREDAIINDLNARGMGGSGIEAALRGQASQAGADRLALSSSEQATANAQQRALAEMQAMQGAASLRSADVNLNTTNADIINKFAMDNAQRKAEINNMNTQLMNQWQQEETQAQRQYEANRVKTANDAELQNNQYMIGANKSANQNLQDQYSAQSNWLNNYYNANQAQNQSMANMQMQYVPQIQGYGASKERNAAIPWLIGAGTVGQLGGIFGGAGGAAAAQTNAGSTSGVPLKDYNANSADDNYYQDKPKFGQV
jgi:hypothetical protein